MIDVLGLEDPRENVTQTATLSKLIGTMGARHVLAEMSLDGSEFQNVYQSINTMSSFFEPICCAQIQLFFQM